MLDRAIEISRTKVQSVKDMAKAMSDIALATATISRNGKGLKQAMADAKAFYTGTGTQSQRARAAYHLRGNSSAGSWSSVGYGRHSEANREARRQEARRKAQQANAERAQRIADRKEKRKEEQRQRAEDRANDRKKSPFRRGFVSLLRHQGLQQIYGSRNMPGFIRNSAMVRGGLSLMASTSMMGGLGVAISTVAAGFGVLITATVGLVKAMVKGISALNRLVSMQDKTVSGSRKLYISSGGFMGAENRMKVIRRRIASGNALGNQDDLTNYYQNMFKMGVDANQNFALVRDLAAATGGTEGAVSEKLFAAGKGNYQQMIEMVGRTNKALEARFRKYVAETSPNMAEIMKFLSEQKQIIGAFDRMPKSVEFYRNALKGYKDEVIAEVVGDVNDPNSLYGVWTSQWKKIMDFLNNNRETIMRIAGGIGRALTWLARKIGGVLDGLLGKLAHSFTGIQDQMKNYPRFLAGIDLYLELTYLKYKRYVGYFKSIFSGLFDGIRNQVNNFLLAFNMLSTAIAHLIYIYEKKFGNRQSQENALFAFGEQAADVYLNRQNMKLAKAKIFASEGKSKDFRDATGLSIMDVKFDTGKNVDVLEKYMKSQRGLDMLRPNVGIGENKALHYYMKTMKDIGLYQNDMLSDSTQTNWTPDYNGLRDVQTNKLPNQSSPVTVQKMDITFNNAKDPEAVKKGMKDVLDNLSNLPINTTEHRVGFSPDSFGEFQIR